jgi:hypothetical protein
MTQAPAMVLGGQVVPLVDPKTYLYIGDSQIALNSTCMPKGTVTGNAVQQQIAVIGKAGQLP